MSDLTPGIAPPHAIHTLYRDHHGWLVSFLRRRLGNMEQAADLAHDAFERILRTGARAPTGEPRAYLTVIAKNLVVNHHRHAAVERAYLDALAQQAEPIEHSPECRAQVIQTLTQLCALLDGLDARAQSIFVLAQFDGMAYQDVAVQLGVSLDVVKKTMSRTLQRCYALFYG